MNFFILLLISFICFNSSLLNAEDFPFDESQSAADELTKGFSSDKGIVETDLNKMNSDRLKIGGGMRQEYKNYRLKNAAVNQLIFAPTTLDLYLDSSLNENVRGLFKGRMIHDAAIDESTSSNNLMGYLTPPKKTTSQLDEMKLIFNANQKVFFTVGVQKIKWGTGLFWNPTDFLNSTKKDLLRTEDSRSGLNLIKLHIPKDKLNFYLIGDFENANQTKSVGSAARIEVAFEQSEWSVSHYSKEGTPSLTGVDTSVAIGDFDITLEGAENSEHKQKNLDGSLSYTWQYTENKTIAFTLEGIWNQDGAASSDDYLTLLTQNKFLPFNTAKAYQLLSIYTAKPFNWINSSLQLLFIRNQMDKSIYSRLGYTWTGQRDLSLSLYGGQRQGESNSEMVFGGQNTELMAEASIQF